MTKVYFDNEMCLISDGTWGMLLDANNKIIETHIYTAILGLAITAVCHVYNTDQHMIAITEGKK